MTFIKHLRAYPNESFTLYSQLPFELRSQIWKLAIVDSPRIIYLWQHTIPTSSTPQSIKASSRFQDKMIRSLFGSRSISTSTSEPHSQTTAYKSRCPLPPSSVRVPSPAHWLKSSTLSHSATHLARPQPMYISFSYDALYLSYSFLCSAVEEHSDASHTDLKADTRKVKHLMIGGVWAPFSQTPWESEFMTCLIKALAAFGGLETVALIDGRHGEDERESSWC